MEEQKEERTKLMIVLEVVFEQSQPPSFPSSKSSVSVRFSTIRTDTRTSSLKLSAHRDRGGRRGEVV